MTSTAAELRPRRTARRRRALLAPLTSLLATAGVLVPLTGPAQATTPVVERQARTVAQPSGTPKEVLDGTAGGTSTAVSGMKMPGDLRGYRRVFADDFTGSSLNSSAWSRYQGVPRSHAETVWRPENTFVEDGKLVLRTAQENGTWYSGGTSNARAGAMTYGKWVVRFRAQKAAGIGYVFLLYPKGGGWPPEIDFAEDGGGDRSRVMGTSHWSPQNLQKHSFLTEDFSRWHTLGVVITPEKVEYTVDGVPWAVHTGDAVPHQPMWLGMQAFKNTCKPQYPGSCVDSTTPAKTDIEIDWVVRYEHA